MSKTENIAFLNNHKPLLKAGEYTIKAEQNVELKGATTDALSDSLSKTIYVAAERFSINQNDIVHMYPPPGKKGNYHNVLPHICLKGSTFPWERSSGIDGESIPWLWLFVYDEDDVANKNVVAPAPYPLNDVFKKGTGTDPYQNGLTLTKATDQKITLAVEPGEADASGNLLTTPVSCIQIKLDWLEGTSPGTGPIMPATDDLPLMAAVRQNETPGDPSSKVEHAICLANRMPKAGKKTYACLLSLEERLGPTTPKGGTQEKAYKATGIDNGYTTFVCLTHWEFDCLSDQYYEITTKGLAKMDAIPNLPTPIQQKVAGLAHNQLFRNQEAFATELDSACSSLATWSTYKDKVIESLAVPDETFAGFMTHLSSQPFQFDELVASADQSTAIINEYLSSGAAAFTHRLNTGEKSLSWYHGPFRPSDKQPTELSMTGLLSSDQLLRFDDQLNMLDVSYAAAWELGRLLTLNNKTVAMDLYAWRRQQAWSKSNGQSRYASVLQPAAGTSLESKEQTTITNWCTKLTQLSDIPYNYLVPDERLLPKESIRFFTLDKLWMNALLDGALSIGRTSTTSPEEEQATISTFNASGSNTVSGFLLHSEAVSGWPHLLVKATSGSGTGSVELDLLHEIRLSTNIMLFLFDGQLSEVDVHLKPEALNFGLDVPAEGSESTYFKKVRFSFSNDDTSTHELTATKNDPGKVSTIPFTNSTAKVLNISALSGDIKTIAYGATALKAPYTSAEFVMEMVEPQAHINFVEGSASGTVKTLSGENTMSATFVSGSDIFGKKGIEAPNPPSGSSGGDTGDYIGEGGNDLGDTVGGGSGVAQDEVIEAVLKKMQEGGAISVQSLVAEAVKNGITPQVTPKGDENALVSKDYIEELLAQIVQKGGLPLLEKLAEDVFEKAPMNIPAPQDQTPKVDLVTPTPVVAETGSGTASEKPVDKLLEGILAKLTEAKATLKTDSEDLKEKGEKLADDLKEKIDNVEAEVKGHVEKAVDEVESVPDKVKALLTKVKTDVTLSEAGVKIMADIIVARIKGKVHDDIDAVKDKASQLAEGILGHIHNAEANFADKAKGVIGDVKSDITDGVEKVIQDVHLVESKAEQLKSDVADHIKDIEGDVVSAAKDTLAKVEGKVRDKVAQLKAEEHLAKQKEAQLLDEITDKIHDVKHAITQKISNIKEDIQSDEAAVLHDAHTLIEGVETKIKDIKTNLKSEVVEKFKDLEKAAIGFFKSPFDAVKRDVAEVKSKVHEDAENVKEDVDKDLQWLKARKALVWMVLGLLLISAGIWVTRTVFGSNEPTPMLLHFEGVKQMEEIEFVKQHYDEVVPVTDKGGQLEFLLNVPATLSGKMDMTQLEYVLAKDSLLKITLPPVILSDVNIDLQNVTSYDDRGKSIKLFLSGGGKAYGQAYESIINAVDEVKKGVLSNAIKNDLMDETRKEARIYLLHIANALGYRVEFIETKPSVSFEKSIENRVGKKLWEQLKHKVRKVDPVDKSAAQTTDMGDKREDRRNEKEDKRENK